MTATAISLPDKQPGALRYPFSKAFGRDLGYALLTGASAIVSFTLLVTGVSLTLSLIVFVVGVFVAWGFALVNRAWTDLQRRFSGWVLGRRIPSAYKRASTDTIAGQMKATASDPQTWRDLLWLTVDSVVGFAVGLMAWVIWGVMIGSLFLPAWWWSMPSDAEYLGMTLNTTSESFIGPAIAVVAFLPFAWLTRGMARGHAHLARLLLRPTGNARVEELTESRAGAVDAAHAELQRIERDLHDGAQARLVALAMDLGMAEKKANEDPEASRELIGEAREETLRALGELRELVRGIGPSILRDRGLEAAIASLTAGRTQPVDVHVDVGDPRPSDVQEAAAYFVVAESLANAAKHSRATRVSVRVTREGDRIVVECSDDGQGGADPFAGSGLSGLAKRVAAIDGEFSVTSPAGGPTRIRAEIPCG